jgi:hypothetical protein
VSDEITLVLPAEEDFRQVARLVVSGLAARLELTFEQLEDMEVALDVVLGFRDDDGDLSIALGIDGDTVSTTVGPFSAHALEPLDRDDGELGMRRVLETVADDLVIERRGGESWVRLTKGAPA